MFTPPHTYSANPLFFTGRGVYCRSLMAYNLYLTILLSKREEREREKERERERARECEREKC